LKQDWEAEWRIFQFLQATVDQCLILHNTVTKEILGLLEGCCSCCYSFYLTCYTGHSQLHMEVLWKCIYFANNYS
jgi:hypothetical protein